jgi:dUTPase
MLEFPQEFPPISAKTNSPIIKLRAQEKVEILPREEFSVDFGTKLKFPQGTYGLMIAAEGTETTLTATPQFIGKNIFY